MKTLAVTFWDILKAPEPIEKILKVLAEIAMFFVWNWFWLRWIVGGIIAITIILIVRKRKSKRQKENEN